jgi:predicted transcriptional regulator
MDAKPTPGEWQDEEGDAPEADLFDTIDEAAEEAAYARAEADAAAGRVVSHEAVSAWLRTWGTSDYAPPPQEWFK